MVRARAAAGPTILRADNQAYQDRLELPSATASHPPLSDNAAWPAGPVYGDPSSLPLMTDESPPSARSLPASAVVDADQAVSPLPPPDPSLPSWETAEATRPPDAGPDGPDEPDGPPEELEGDIDEDDEVPRDPPESSIDDADDATR